MSQVRKSPGSGSAHGVIYDLAERRRQVDGPDEAPRGSDQAGVSESGRKLAGARAAVEPAPEARAERIARLKAEIAAGTYNPDPKEIAQKLLERGF